MANTLNRILNGDSKNDSIILQTCIRYFDNNECSFGIKLKCTLLQICWGSVIGSSVGRLLVVIQSYSYGKVFRILCDLEVAIVISLRNMIKWQDIIR